MTAAAHPDAKIFERIAALKAAWSSSESGPLTDEALTAHLAANFNAPERELRTMRPATIAGALAKLEFFRWDYEVSASYDPLEWEIDVAIADLQALAGRGTP